MKRKKKRVNNNNNNNTNNEIMIQNIITKDKDRKKYTSYTMKYNLIKQRKWCEISRCELRIMWCGANWESASMFRMSHDQLL